MDLCLFIQLILKPIPNRPFPEITVSPNNESMRGASKTNNMVYDKYILLSIPLNTLKVLQIT